MDNQNMEYLATGFREVDKSSDIGKMVTCLRFLEGLPSFIAYKERSFELMQLSPGDVAVDIGCGLGFDVPKLKKLVVPNGRAIGLDISQKLLEAASRSFSGNSIEFIHGDVHDLKFPENSIDGIRVDRALQHVENPQKVISEMVRVLKPGKWMVCAEPDWNTFVIDSDNTEMTEMVTKKWNNSFRNPWIGRQLLRRVRTSGLQNTWCEGFILLADGLEAVDLVYDVVATVKKLKQGDNTSDTAFDDWFLDLKKRDNNEGLSASVTLFLAGGQKVN